MSENVTDCWWATSHPKPLAPTARPSMDSPEDSSAALLAQTKTVRDCRSRGAGEAVGQAATDPTGILTGAARGSLRHFATIF